MKQMQKKHGKKVMDYGFVKKNLFTGHYSVECKACGAKMTGEMLNSTKAIEEWNRRNNHGSSRK